MMLRLRKLTVVKLVSPNWSTPSSILQKNFSAAVVGGLGVDEKELKVAAWDLYSKLFDLRPSAKKEIYEKVTLIVDTSKLPNRVKNEDVKKVVNFIQSTKERDTCAIFAHSHGAKIVAEALKNKDCKRVDTFVFTLGGIESLTESYPQRWSDLQLADDSASHLGKAIFGRKNKELRATISELLWDKEKRSSFNSHAFSLVIGSYRHALADYFNTDWVMKAIRQKLSREKDFRAINKTL